MKNKTFIALLLAFIFTDVTYTFAIPDVRADEKTVAHLNQFRSDYIKSILDRKPEMIKAYYSDSTRLMPEYQKTIMSKSNVLYYHQIFSKRFDVQEYSRDVLEILDLGPQVIETGNLTMKMALRSTGQEHALKGAYLNIWEKLESGELLLITEAWNYDRYYEGLDTLLRFQEVPSVHIALLPNITVNSPISFELAALNRLLDATVTQHDASLWSQFYAEDAKLIPNYQPICHGRKAINAYIEMHVKELPIFEELDIRNDRIDNLGDYVVEYASHIASWKSGEYSGIGLGKNIRIWRREPDHSLKLFRSIAMYD